uniref:NADH-ubiquinone oxidoreductase chain 3 n=1 Tax=Plakortis angulospiculatus TaxID=295227 RepID=B0F967_9METZ|nr:NADH dehydrogenase subunit 3 [Plakinastrella cf. onkodes DVL-2011]ABW83953.1 NADH dehydrogenase subunit 3 [Plakinastrella cf. onkodes DVL-2011]
MIRAQILEFFVIFIMLCVSIGLSIIISGASYTLGVKQPDSEKVSVYECGFDPFESSRIPFSVRFFLIGILFMIFDLEISFIFPWSVVFNQITLFGYWTMIVFLIILTLGLIYEWVKGGLEWE